MSAKRFVVSMFFAQLFVRTIFFYCFLLIALLVGILINLLFVGINLVIEEWARDLLPYFGLFCGVVVALVFTPYNIARISKREKLRGGSFAQWLREFEFESGFQLTLQLGSWEEPAP